jgi:hypothetical protein
MNFGQSDTSTKLPNADSSISRRVLLLAFVTLLGGKLQDSAHAQDVYSLQDHAALFHDQPSSAVPIQSTSLASGISGTVSSIANVLDETSSANQSGLLGRAYIDGQYISLVTPEELEEFTSTMPGFRTSLNIPAPWNNRLPTFLSQDIFISARHLEMSGTTDVAGLALSMESEIDNWAVGTTLFTTIDNTFHPFVQIGYDFQRFEFQSSSILGTFSEAEDDHRFLCVPGFEIDITTDLGLRFGTELDFEDMSSSIMTTELVYWLTPNIFARGGLINDVEWEAYGGLIGGGIAY